MAIFSGKQKEAGWLAIVLHASSVDLVHVRRAVGRIEVVLCDTYRKEGSDVETLARLRRELKLDRYRITTLLASGDYQVQALDAPNVPANELKTAIRWKVKEVIDYPVESATIDVLNIPGNPDAPSRDRQVYAVSAPNNAIERCVAPFNMAELPLEAVDIPDLAQRNIAALFEADGRGVAMLAFDDKGGTLTFTGHGELYLTRRVEISASQLLNADDERRDQYFERIALELQRSLDHFDRQFHHVPIARLLIAPLAKEIGLQAYLVPQSYVPVETVDLATVLDVSAVPELKHLERQAQCLLAIGAALRDENA